MIMSQEACTNAELFEAARNAEKGAAAYRELVDLRLRIKQLEMAAPEPTDPWRYADTDHPQDHLAMPVVAWGLRLRMRL
jgi:hypothetical protein